MTINLPLLLPRGDDALAGHPELSGYQVVEGRHGTAIYGPVPVSDLAGLQTIWEAKGYTVWDTGLAAALGATICAASKVGAAAWREEVEAQARERAGDDDELLWALGTDTGRSAALLLLTLGASQPAKERAFQVVARGGTLESAIPYDPDDLGRCIRLLDLFPAWRERLPLVAALRPAWAPFVARWAELEDLYRRELPSGWCPAAHALLRELQQAAKPADAKTEATIDLSALSGEEYTAALDGLFATVHERSAALPDRLFIKIPPAPGATALLWSRDEGELCLWTFARRAVETAIGRAATERGFPADDFLPPAVRSPE